MRIRSGLTTAALIALIAATGCSASIGDGSDVASEQAPGPAGAPALPPRPQEVRLDDVDPCSLLTAEQLRRLDVRGGQFRPADDRYGANCRWVHSPQEPVEAYLIALDVSSGIETSFDNPGGSAPITVAGFPAIETESPELRLPDTQCIVVVDVAPGQALQVNYDYAGSLPMTRERACDRARPAAEMAMRTLIEQAGG